MLRLSEISKWYGARRVLDEVSLAVSPGEKVALVGANGVGKTTLLRIVCGEEQADGGRVQLASGWHVGYLPQDAGVVDARTLHDEMLAAHADLLQIQHEIAEVEQAIAAAAAVSSPRSQVPTSESQVPSPRSQVTVHLGLGTWDLGLGTADLGLEALVERQAELLARFDARGGYRVEAEIHKVLAGLGFREDDLHKRTDQFSGGWRTRIALAKLLVRSPDVLLLDEPTNHLDLEAAEWLEGYLKTSTATAIVVSHDRYFLDRCISRTVELEGGKLAEYAGNYSAYAAEKARRRQTQQAAYDRQQRELKRQQEFIDRFRAKSSKATQVKSREKQLAKIERVAAPTTPTRTIALRFAQARPSHREVVMVRDVAVAYGAQPVFERLDLALERGERLALVGPNGAGKSTLLKLLAGVITPTSGTVRLGIGVEIGYYAQDQTEVLDTGRTVLEEAWTNAPADWGEERLRTLLGRFCFTGEDVAKPVGVLSGGEKSRLALANLLLRPCNLLLLDEPTNHLDLDSREELERAILAFHGTVVMASHDRYFMDRLATKVGEVSGGSLRVFLGNYTAYRERRVMAGGSSGWRPSPAAPPTNTPPIGQSATAASPELARPARARGRPRRGPSAEERELARVESELERVTARRTVVEAMLADPAHYGEPGALEALAAEHAELEAARQSLEARWEELAELVLEPTA